MQATDKSKYIRIIITVILVFLRTHYSVSVSDLLSLSISHANVRVENCGSAQFYPCPFPIRNNIVNPSYFLFCSPSRLNFTGYICRLLRPPLSGILKSVSLSHRFSPLHFAPLRDEFWNCNNPNFVLAVIANWVFLIHFHSHYHH